MARPARAIRLAVGAVAIAGTLATSISMGATDAAAAAGVDHPPSAPTQLTVDDDAHPLAVEGAPQFGWIVRDVDRGEVQTAYELVVRELPVGRGQGRVVWQSGKVVSHDQAYVTAPGLVLQPGRAYEWTVRTWDRSGRVGPRSARAHFEMGVADADWHAAWIHRPGVAASTYDDFSLLRTAVSVGRSPIVRARVYASAGQQYDLRVNGVRVAHGPSFSYPDESYYEATDVTRQVQAGRENVLAVVAHWETPGQGRPASVPGFIARVVIDHADGSTQVVTTDNSWRAHSGPWVPGLARNDEGDFVEHIDARLTQLGWDRAGFDDRTWPNAEVLGVHPVAPFLHLFAARTHIVERPLTPVRLTRLADGATVVDFGAVNAATPIVKFHTGHAGRAVTIVGGYLLDPNGHVSTTRGVQQTDMHWDYTERAGAQEFRPFSYLGFRYLEVIGAAEPLRAADVNAVARHASVPDEHAAQFHTSKPALDAVWNLARHSSLNASQEQFVDTPTREKGAFMDPFDSPVVMAAFGDRAMTFEALRDFARSQARYWPDGRVNVVYPNGDGKRDIPDSTEQYVEWVWQTYLTTGNREQLASLYPVVKNISDYVARAIDPTTGLVTDLPGGGDDYLYGIVDWPPQMRYGYDVKTVARTTENILAFDVFHRVSQMARALDRPDDEIGLPGVRANSLGRAIQARLRRPDGVFVDGLHADGTASTHASQLANAYAVVYQVAGTDHGAIADHLVRLKNAMGVSTFPNLLLALHALGRDDAVVAALADVHRPGYAKILQQGATYIWEAWDARQTGDSESHAWGSPVLTALNDDILGVRGVLPGGAELAIATPKLTPMHARGVVVTQRGRVPIAWTRGPKGRFSLEVTIPANVVATVSVSAARVTDVRDGGRSLHGDPGVTRAVGTGTGTIRITLGSGHYVLRVAS